MAFLSDIHLNDMRSVAGNRARAIQIRVNWRLLFALGVNLAVWTAAIQFVRDLI